MARKRDRSSESFTSWKLDILNAAGLDENLKPASVRLLLRIVEALDEDKWDRTAGTCGTYLPDDVIADEIPGFKDRDRKTINSHRKALAAAGWLTFEPGHGRRATIYVVSEKQANPILDRREELKGPREKRREADRKRRDMERLARVVAKGEGGKQPRKSSVRGGQTPLSEGGVYPPLHLSHPPSPLALRDQDVALPAHDPDTGEIVPPTTASPLICTECGKPAVIRCRDKGEAYCARHTPSWLRAGIDYRRLSEGE
ncbi:hypothetical protein LPC10_25430 (plasmid) [Methylorubrum sp. B1-46]|uniref:hypothetical protein n=1 Tax=Methylorubrum sp. B1-46 TaxID=2897334 RepID=UPI001E4AF805|nr:hypothetical protein [Methylorubrum sp. B1-46]UGB28685.1 hypothetical protein LPC10_25430 [Methylorubrum sp. B1-46]